jgi:hypothetical protein
MARPPSDNFAEVEDFHNDLTSEQTDLNIFSCRPQYLPLNTRLSARGSARPLRGTSDFKSDAQRCFVSTLCCHMLSHEHNLASCLILFHSTHALTNETTKNLSTLFRRLDWSSCLCLKFIHPQVHSPTSSSTHKFIHSQVHSQVHSPTSSSTHKFIHPQVHPPTSSSIHKFIHPQVHPPTSSSIHKFIHLQVHPCTCLTLILVVPCFPAPSSSFPSRASQRYKDIGLQSCDHFLLAPLAPHLASLLDHN